MDEQREKLDVLRNSLVVHWLRLDTITAGAWVQSLVRELRSNRLCRPAPPPPKMYIKIQN